MCGINGLIDLKGRLVSSPLLQKMMDAIQHRGPDGEGHWIENNVGFGHRRLAVIDLTPAGRQPMVSDDGRYVLVYNGEVYNYCELRTELKRAGCRFHSKTDSEVVLNALAVWGSCALLRFNGMFSLALWDREKKQLLIARDRYGIKPFYYTEQNSCFAFASEQKAILELPGISRKIDKQGLVEYFTFQNFFTDHTLLEKIKILPAGHYGILDIGKDNPQLCLHQYWDYHFCEPSEKTSKEEYCEELDHLFRRAVRRQLVSDVELGSYLSGGMDSGSITAVAAKSNPYLKTFTCGFDLSSASGIELAFDERVKAEAMSARFRTEHYEMVLKAGDMERTMAKLAWHLEEPRVGQSYPNYYAAKLAGKFVKVVLSGSGGDELFGGYPWRYYRAAVCDNFDHYIDQYYNFWQRLIPDDVVEDVFAPIWKDVKHIRSREIFRDVFLDHDNHLERPEDYINHSLYFESKTFLHGLLTVEDKLSMAHGLESRVPFLDNELVDFAMRCPVGLKLNNLQEVLHINENVAGDKRGEYFQKTRDGKQILRDMMKRYIPQDVANGIKQGFSAPDASWFKGESIEFVRRKLLKGEPRIYEFMDRKTVEGLVEEHMSGKRNRRLFIWSLLSVEEFLSWTQAYI